MFSNSDYFLSDIQLIMEKRYLNDILLDELYAVVSNLSLTRD